MVKSLGREREKDRRWSPVHSVLHPMVARTGILTSENPWLDFSTVVLKPAVHSNTRNTIYIKVLSFILQRSHLLIFDRDVSSFGECDWLCATLVLLCEWSGFLKQPLFGDEAGFSAAVIGAFLSSLSRGIVSLWFTMMKTFNFFTAGQMLIWPMCASPQHCLCKVRNFPVLNLLRLQRKKNLLFFILFAPLEKTVIKWEFGKFFSSVE